MITSPPAQLDRLIERQRPGHRPTAMAAGCFGGLPWAGLQLRLMTLGVGLTQLSKLSTDFANISERSYSYIKKAIWGHLATALGIISLAVAVLALLVPSLVTVLTGALEAKYSESQNGESIKRLESQIKALQSKLSEKDPATLGSQQQHTKRLSDESL
ncbi:hypothetical protein N5K55_19895 [Pseudomonas aeruginosa]|nr:hypothetical protein [Pseudomonas aeruginosa]